MNSGIEITDEVFAAYKQMAMKRKLRYVIYKPSEDGSKIEIEFEGAREETFDDMKNKIERCSSR